MVASMATARGLPTPRLMPTTATLVLATAMEATAMAAFTATARGLPTPRLMPITATLVLVTVTAATATGSVQLMPSPTTATDTAVSATATVWVTPTASKTASLLPRTTFKGGAASTEIKKNTKKVQFQVSKFLIKKCNI